MSDYSDSISIESESNKQLTSELGIENSSLEIDIETPLLTNE
jgi:hypothetical protein